MSVDREEIVIVSEPPDSGTEQSTCASHEELLRLRLAVEASGEVIFMTDAQGTFTYVNPEFERVYGYTSSELVGRTTPRVLKSGSTGSDDYESFWHELRNHRVVKREFVNRTKDGSLVIIECSANPIVVGHELVGFLAVQRDVTERKATEAALRQSDTRCRTLAEAARDSIFIVRKDERIEYANAITGERFGLRAEEAIGRRLHEVFPEDVATEMWRELSKVFSSGQAQYVEGKFTAPAGDLWLGTWFVPVPSEITEDQAVMGVARDITDRKRLEREFAQAQKMDAVGRLAGGIAHDFNNLLTAILGYSELLLHRCRHDSALAEDVNEIRKAGERASRLTRQLLTFSRKHTSQPRLLDLNHVVKDLQRMLERVIGEDVLLDVVTDSELDATQADPSQVEQLIVNLVVNARDAMPRGGTLRIATANVELDLEFARRHDGAVPGRYVAIGVQDTGCGMTPDVLAHVFEPFFTTKPAGKGTGLGLSTVYGIVKQSGAYIAIDSEPGRGTTVTTYFPVAAGGAQPRTAGQTPAKRLAGIETILLVEDEPGLQRLIQRTLEHYGYTVLTTGCAADALVLAERHAGAIHLLLSDVVMPGLSGPELAQRVVGVRPDLKVLYISGFAGHAALEGALLSARASFLAKPFTSLALATKVRDRLDSAGTRAAAENH